MTQQQNKLFFSLFKQEKLKFSDSQSVVWFVAMETNCFL